MLCGWWLATSGECVTCGRDVIDVTVFYDGT